MAPFDPAFCQSIDFEKWRRMIVDGASAFDLHPTDLQIGLFFQHMEALLQWSPKVNLTAIHDPYEIAVKHFVDSIVPAAFFSPALRVLDMGSGAGFPGLPLKVWFPSVELTMVDAVRKKVSFLQYAARQMGLKNVQAVHARIEQWRPPSTGRVFDTIVCRAFSDLSFIAMNALPLLSKKGQLVIWKGRFPENELAAVRPVLESAPYRRTMQIESYRLPFIDAQRTLLIISAHEKGQGLMG